MTRIAVLVSGGGTNLQALIDRREQLGGELALVVSSRADAHALERARRAGIPAEVLEKQPGIGSAAYSALLCEKLERAGIDLVVLAGFLVVLAPAFIEAFRNRILNVHPSLLPAFGGRGCYGLRVHEMALARGVRVTGATVHFVNEETDGGPIVFQHCLPVLPSDTPETLQRRVMEQAEWLLLPKAVRYFCTGRLSVEGNRVHIREEEQ
ncbi:MAG: phosphoribosylglycinamide formyltransferase [Clostridiales bacterium]|nr:phosphoribosylglycinamide formyltransferase [Clostridiales bacterium]